MVSGTSYDIVGGRTLTGGTGYDISFIAKNPTAMLYSDGSFVVQEDASIEPGKTLTASYTNIDETDTPAWNGQQKNFTSITFDAKIRPQNMAFWFSDAVNATGNINDFDIDMKNTASLSYAFANCHNLKGQPITSDKVFGMYSTYRNCYNLTGDPVCGPNTTSLAHCYEECSKLTGEPVIGDKVTDISYAYYNCKNLRGGIPSAYKATNMSHAFCNCWYLTGSPTCGPNVTDMSYAYDRCYNIIGNAVCGNKVTNMSWTYYNCRNLTGSLIAGQNVTTLVGTYAEIGANLGSDAYFFSKNISNAAYAVFNKSNSKRLNIYIPGGSTTQTTVLNGTSGYSLVGNTITYTQSGNYYYNTAYNIYIYPVTNVAAGANGGAYLGEPTAMLYSDGSMVFQYGEGVAAGKTLVASYTGFESTINAPPWDGKQKLITSINFNCIVTPISMANWLSYHWEANSNFTGNLNDYTNLNLNNTTSMAQTFQYLNKLKGQPIVGNNVTNMSSTYFDCSNITGHPVCGPKVLDMHCTYSFCDNLSGPYIAGPSVQTMTYTYLMFNYHRAKNAYLYSPNIVNAKGCFSLVDRDDQFDDVTYNRLNIYAPENSITMQTLLTSTDNSIVESNITYTNAGTYYYNTWYNIYIYPVENVAAARAANGD